ncbi:type II toxin-antitoxin system HipA family toxin [Actinoplanes sp. LDG1-06]|uniref:Type II toxin-antitoxin system HipA family toxin n=1 Tax=Paractinoplanes ovalisporus TaxID=2810368 RepID=A0ABS2AE55_9ACTN|nr:type II toxin-antitoxin system HipA family toxin [Actinoplanes ovalisporus]MBM2618116.1 type II toxin-antitoxin system HipA family toxin [Actinoplanes ovalisporus]
MSRELVVMLGGRRAGMLRQGNDGILTLEYDADYRSAETSLPLSLSLPLTRGAYTGSVVRAYCQGLLPDNENVLERWGREFQVSAGNPFALLNHVGEDCAGEAQFVTGERVEAMLAYEGKVEPLTEERLAERLQILRRDPSAWHLAGTGQFSLAGAQAKTALHFDATSGRWGDPSGAIPTTHILKPAISGFDDHDLNEHLCLRAAQNLGLRAASSRVLSFGGERAVVVDRYDRFPAGGGRIVRVHQEDMCQALGLPPTAKYQSEGGPAPEQIIDLIRRVVTPAVVAEQEVGRFVDALALNWLIAGTDAHAKNYSLLLRPGQARLAPLYDVASSLPYDDMYLPRLRLAMKIGSEYRVEAITGRHWAAFAERNRLDPARVRERIGELAGRLPDALREAAAADAVRALGSDLPGRLVARITEHAARCAGALGGT